MTAPDEPDDDAEANLGTLTDDDWLAQHERLTVKGGLPQDELTFVWNPGLDGDTLIDESERVTDGG